MPHVIQSSAARRFSRPVAFCAALAVSLVPSLSVADEGMWPYNMVPTAELQSKYSFTPSAQWLSDAQAASVRFNNGGSGSFVSADGLVMTNHHVGADCIQKLSQGANDYMKQGFTAASRSGEIKCPDLELNQLINITDVTAEVMTDAASAKSDADKQKARKAKMAGIEKRCADKTGGRCDVVTLYSGGAYHLYQYKKYTDVRLAFAPEFQAAFFGGDPDNFNYPRMALDVTFFRAYENDAPVKTPYFFPFSKKGAQDKQLVFVSGNPGSTGRFDTVAKLQHLRDVAYPFILSTLKKKRDGLKAFMDQGDAQFKSGRDDFFGAENGIKAITGYLGGLNDPKLMAEAQRRETEVQALVKTKVDVKDQPALLQAWPRLKTGYDTYNTYYTAYAVLESRYWAPGGTLAGIARHIHRMNNQMRTRSGERLREYRDTNLKSLELRLFSEAPIDTALEIEHMSFYLQLLQETLGKADVTVKAALAGKTPAMRAKELVEGTRLRDVAVRQAFYKNPMAVTKANDPMMNYVKAIDAAALKLRKRYEEGMESVEKNYAGRIAEAYGKAYGTSVYPDATFTLRLNHGEVKGFDDNGTPIKWKTQIGDLYVKAQRKGEKAPYDLPPQWKANMSKVDFTVPYNFISTNDIIGGNSGSPVFNKEREIVGIVFDGNLYMLPNRFIYRAEKGRAVSVHSNAILHALDRVYGAKALLGELQAGQAK